MSELIFYTTEGCHLCDLAEQVLKNINLHQAVKFVDISDSEALVKLYGTRIPVVEDTATSEVLCWPFDENSFIEWLKA
ncbi:glutaredoxin family protein [Catenovulum maritimum]|uniref:Glutaredoxin n=1 Tax=Catenovulum maritimum TaxID=1513271 RepID=A0A0J8JI42_9ALTE|nr:glutaredoxin family protein [Catenovulum maritimum]KMT64121.1 glutaredoxin [Catenovulum maritimum]